MRFKVVITGRDCFRFLSRSLRSVADQDDNAVDVCVVDDASEDLRQPELMERFCQARGWTFVRNEERHGALYNHVVAVEALSPEPDDVIASVDADDRLSGLAALSTVRAYYDRFKPCLTYGSYVPDPPDPRVMPARHLPDEVIRNNAYRAFSARDDDEDPIWFNHLRTIKYDLFARLDPALDFRHSDGTWFMTCYDLAITIPALEMAAGRHLMLPDVLYLYTRDNPRSDCYVHTEIIDRDKARIFSISPKQPLYDIVVPPRVEGLW